MATYYVDSNATGLNDGSSWTDAWTGIESASSAGSGDIVLVSSNHSETMSGTSLTWAASDAKPVVVISTDTSTNQPSAGATIASNNNILYGSSYSYHGIRFEVGFGEHRIGTNGRKTEFTNCTLAGKSGGGAPFYSQGVFLYTQYYYAEVIFNNCTFDFTNAYANSSRCITVHTAKAILNDCTIIRPSISDELFRISSAWQAYADLEVNDTDLSSITTLFALTKQSFAATLRRCSLSSGYTIPSIPASSGNVSVQDCAVGTISDPLVVCDKYLFQGSQQTSKTEYRSSGASDGTSNFSLNLTTSVNAQEGASSGAVQSSAIEKYVQSGSQTITVYIAGGASLNNDDFWIEVESPSELASPTAQGKFRTTKPDPLATPTALTSDTSSWTGTGVGTAQKVEVAISPTIAGTVTVRCYLAKPSTTVYVDPKISTDGYQRVFNGVLVDGDAVGGGGGAVLHPLRSN